ncbi:MAG TPA: hypothetical protein VJU84_10450 [Pyrinomonadaceae bacterium]|nr:hypothetical protein [Pyrinomonadaceae bacterium]
MRSKQILLVASFVTFIVSLVVFSGIGHSASPGPATDSPSIVNKTRSFEVVGVNNEGKELHLQLKNNYTKTITAFEISIGPDFSVTEEFVFAEVSDAGIKPQGIFSKSYPLPSTTQQMPTFDVTIKTIVLDDGSGDGDALAFEDIKAKRLGEEIQLRRAVEMLGRFFEKSESDIEQLKADVTNALNRDSDKPLSGKIKQGLDRGRANVLRKMAEIEDQNSEVEKLKQVKGTYERILTRL